MNEKKVERKKFESMTEKELLVVIAKGIMAINTKLGYSNQYLKTLIQLNRK